MYQHYIGEFVNFIIRLSDIAWIPFDDDNRDYQDFLKYLDDNDLTLNDIPNYEP